MLCEGTLYLISDYARSCVSIGYFSGSSVSCSWQLHTYKFVCIAVTAVCSSTCSRTRELHVILQTRLQYGNNTAVILELVGHLLICSLQLLRLYCRDVQQCSTALGITLA